MVLRIVDIARKFRISQTRASQLVRHVEPAAVTPGGTRLYDPSILDTLRRRRERNKTEVNR
jgi:hypothetical protein